MTANDSKYYLNYLNKLVDEYNNTYHCTISKKPIDSDYSVLTEEMESSYKLLNLNLVIVNIFSKGYTKNWSREIFVIEFLLKANAWTYKIKDLIREKIIGSFMKKTCC